MAGSLQSYRYDYDNKKLAAKWEARKDGITTLYMPDLSAIYKSNLAVSRKSKVNIESFEDASGGFVTITALEDGMVEAVIG
ncbi:hypothetical protein [Cohnella sp.]|uniref:hypothetical protein n=1 Tax=Cohnella sp. TaxID=1883426 RepID=UPI003563D510